MSEFNRLLLRLDNLSDKELTSSLVNKTLLAVLVACCNILCCLSTVLALEEESVVEMLLLLELLLLLSTLPLLRWLRLPSLPTAGTGAPRPPATLLLEGREAALCCCCGCWWLLLPTGFMTPDGGPFNALLCLQMT